MDRKQLAYFLAVAEERSVTRTAARLHLTSRRCPPSWPAWSGSRGCGCWSRHRRGVDLTEVGRDLAERARRLLADAEAAAEAVTQTGQGRSGRLTLAFLSATAASVLPALLRRFRVDRPDVSVRFSRTTRRRSPRASGSGGPTWACCTCRSRTPTPVPARTWTSR